MRDIKFSVTQEVLDLGVKIQTVQIKGIKNTKSTPELDVFLAQELEKIKTVWDGKIYNESPILQGFRDLHTKVGRSNRDYPASPEVLLRLFLERGRFPRINSIVDIYNFISLKTQLALGAHDVEHIDGNVTLRLTKGDETFLPLGKTEKVTVPVGEYAYCDDGNNIICRLEVLQVEPTKITLEAQNIFLIIQGNTNSENTYIQNATQELVDLLVKYCGGEYKLLNKLI